MATGSQQPSREWFGGRTECSGCGKKLTLKNFGHVRTTYPSGNRDAFCLTCIELQVRDNMEMTRESLGMSNEAPGF